MTQRKPDFKKDNEIGKIGENYFYALMKGKGRNIIDVSSDSFFWSRDIDFVELLGSTTIEETKQWLSSHTHPNDYSFNKLFKLYEVKTDLRTLETGNIVYEIISHNRQGCMAKTDADIVIYILMSEEYDIVESYSLLTCEWRKWIRDHYNDKSRVRLNNHHMYDENGKDEGNLDMLCCLKQLSNDGVAIKFNIKNLHD